MARVTFAREGSLGLITLTRPEKLNALTAAMMDDLAAALDQAETDEGVRVIVLSGEGRAFSAGFDLSDGDWSSEAAVRKEVEHDFAVIHRFWTSPKPTIAAVQGHCLGGGFELALACDLTLADESARFGAPELRFGSGIVYMILPWLVGPKQAKELLLSANDRMSAEEAKSIGLINRVVPAGEHLLQAKALALEIAGNDQLSVTLTKRAINGTFAAMGLDAALAQARELEIEIEATETDESKAFNAVLKKDGVKAAVEWRKARLDHT